MEVRMPAWDPSFRGTYGRGGGDQRTGTLRFELGGVVRFDRAVGFRHAGGTAIDRANRPFRHRLDGAHLETTAFVEGGGRGGELNSAGSIKVRASAGVPCRERQAGQEDPPPIPLDGFPVFNPLPPLQDRADVPEHSW